MDSNQLKIVTIDAVGKPCPMPLLMLKRTLKSNSITESIIHLISSDQNSEIDIMRYCHLHQLNCILTSRSAKEFHYKISQLPQD